MDFESAISYAGWTAVRLRRLPLLLYTLAVPPLPAYVPTYTVANTQAKFKITSPAEVKQFHAARSLFAKHNIWGERSVLADLVSRLESDDVFYDIGANIGLYTCFAVARIRSGSVHAFEPHPDNRSKLRENVELNDGSANLHNVALSNSTGEEEFAIGDPEKESQGAVGFADADEDSFMIQTRPCDEYRESYSLPFPTVVKIDVEGAEIEVLEGMEKILADESCRLVYCEVHLDKAKDAKTKVEGKLKDKGFSVDVVHRRGNGIFLRGTRR